MAFFLSPLLAGWMAVYLALSLSYSLWIKKTLIIDTFALTALTMHRVLTGFLIAGTAPTFWLLLFTGFFVLRPGDAGALWRTSGQPAFGHQAGDAGASPTGRAISISWRALASPAAIMAVLILALYALTPEAHAAFRSPQALGSCARCCSIGSGGYGFMPAAAGFPRIPFCSRFRIGPAVYVAVASVGIFCLAAFAVLPLYPII